MEFPRGSWLDILIHADRTTIRQLVFARIPRKEFVRAMLYIVTFFLGNWPGEDDVNGRRETRFQGCVNVGWNTDSIDQPQLCVMDRTMMDFSFVCLSLLFARYYLATLLCEEEGGGRICVCDSTRFRLSRREDRNPPT